MKDSVLWELDRGEKRASPEIGRAELKRTELHYHARQFMARYEFFVLPVSQVPPFDVTEAYPTEIAEVKMATWRTG